MVRAIQLDNKGNEINGTEREFTEEKWAEMQRHFGKYLRWKQCTAKAVKKDKSKHNITENEKTDLPFDGGGISDAVAE